MGGGGGVGTANAFFFVCFFFTSKCPESPGLETSKSFHCFPEKSLDLLDGGPEELRDRGCKDRSRAGLADHVPEGAVSCFLGTPVLSQPPAGAASEPAHTPGGPRASLGPPWGLPGAVRCTEASCLRSGISRALGPAVSLPPREA